MQPPLISHPTLFDAADLTAPATQGDWRAALPVTNLQDMQPGRVARTTNLSNTFVVVPFPQAIACTTFWAFATNLSASATIRIRAATSEANLTAAPGYDSGSISAWPATGRPTDYGLTRWSVFKKFTNSTAYVWWRVDFSDGSNPDGYIEIGRAFLAPIAFQPAVGMSYGWGNQYNPADVQNRTPFGHILTQARQRPRSFSMTFDWLSEAEMWDGINTLQRLRGLAGDIGICLDADATTYLHQRTMQGVFADIVPMVQPYFNIFSAKVAVVELL